MTSPAAPLRIAILGVGKIGSAFAFQLVRTGGHDVTVIARPDSVRLAQLERDQAIVDIKGERAGVRVAGRLDEEAPYDLLIVTLLAHQTEPLLPALQRSAASCIQFMFNTFQPERLQAAIGLGRCAFGMPFVQATLDGDGRLKVAIGAGGQKTIMSQQRWVDVFNAAGLPSALELQMPLWLRCHVPLCVAFESVSVAGELREGGASWDEALVLARGVHAGFALIKVLGYDIYPRAKKRIDGSPTWAVAMMLWFISRIRSFRELLATGKPECCALVDAMVSAAPLGGPPVVVAHIEAMKPS
ncbi:MAG TPA: 2-dehydropantoate 2-reductase [Caulobacteraceae bacterium]